MRQSCRLTLRMVIGKTPVKGKKKRFDRSGLEQLAVKKVILT